jgi:hypothetical protein
VAASGFGNHEVSQFEFARTRVEFYISISSLHKMDLDDIRALGD